MSQFLTKIGSSFLLLVILSGCGGSGTAELNEWMADVKKNAKVNIPKLSEPKVYVPIAYTRPDGIDDPFSPSKLLVVFDRMKNVKDPNAPDPNRLKEPLESYPLDTMRMVGYIENKKGKYAVLQIDKVNHQVAVGMRIGQDDGLITKVTETGIVIKEKILDAADNAWVDRESKLELQETKK
jgi:type IV pilus assembly protein PilP